MKVLVAVDESKTAEEAFSCEFGLFFILPGPLHCFNLFSSIGFFSGDDDVVV